MHDFYVTFTQTTSFDAMVRGMEEVASTWRQSGNTFYFSKEWGTSPRDLANLKGKIQSGSGGGSVARIGVDDASSDSRSDSASD